MKKPTTLSFLLHYICSIYTEQVTYAVEAPGAPFTKMY